MDLDRVANFIFFTRKLEKALFFVKGKEGNNISLKGIHVLCLFFLAVKGPMSVMDLARATQEDKGAVSKALDKLRKLFYIEPKRKYMDAIRLTRTGEIEAAKLLHRVQKIASAARDGISDEQADAFLKTLHAYVNNFDRALEYEENRQSSLCC